jgi:hypothetical protein
VIAICLSVPDAMRNSLEFFNDVLGKPHSAPATPATQASTALATQSPNTPAAQASGALQSNSTNAATVTIEAPKPGAEVGSCVNISGTGAGVGQHFLLFDVQDGARAYYFDGQAVIEPGGRWTIERVLLSTQQQWYNILVYNATSEQAAHFLSGGEKESYSASDLPGSSIAEVQVRQVEEAKADQCP